MKNFIKKYKLLEFLLLALLFTFLSPLTACLNTKDLLARYQRIELSSLPPQTNWLQIQIYACRATPQKIFQVNRDIKNPLGTENLYLPKLPSGRLEIRILAFQRKQLSQTLLASNFRQFSHRLGPLHFSQIALKRGAFLPPQPCRLVSQDKKEKFFPRLPAPTNPQTITIQHSPFEPFLLNRRLQLPSLNSSDHSRSQASNDNSSKDKAKSNKDDRLSSCKKIELPSPAGSFARFAHYILLASTTSDQLHLINTVTRKLVKTIYLSKGCQPRGIAIQGDLGAYICYGTHRLHFFSPLTWQSIGPKQGIEIAPYPFKIAISGRIIAILHENNALISFVKWGNNLAIPAQFHIYRFVYGSPMDIKTYHGNFFIAYENHLLVKNKGGILQLKIDEKFQPTLLHTYRMRFVPHHFAVDQRHIIVLFRYRYNVVFIFNRNEPFSRPHSLYIYGHPTAVSILSNKAFVLTKRIPRLYFIDLKKYKIQDVRPLPVPSEHILQTGSALYFISSRQNHLFSYPLDHRQGSLNLSIGVDLQQPYLLKNQAWIFDSHTKDLLKIDLQLLTSSPNHINANSSQIERIHYVKKQKMMFTSSWLLRLLRPSSSSPLTLFVSPITSFDSYRTFSLPHTLLQTRLVEDTFYFVFSDSDNQKTQRFLASIEFPKATFISPSFSHRMKINFLPDEEEIVDFLPLDSSFIFAVRQKKLYLLKEDRQASLSVTQKLQLPSIPKNMKLFGNKLILLFDDYDAVHHTQSFYVIDTNTLKNLTSSSQSFPQKRLRAHISDFIPYKKSQIILVDNYNDRILFFDLQSNKIRAQIHLNSQPLRAVLWQKNAQELFLLVTYSQSGYLSLVPIPASLR